MGICKNCKKERTHIDVWPMTSFCSDECFQMWSAHFVASQMGMLGLEEIASLFGMDPVESDVQPVLSEIRAMHDRVVSTLSYLGVFLATANAANAANTHNANTIARTVISLLEGRNHG